MRPWKGGVPIYIRFNLEEVRIKYLQVTRVLPWLPRCVIWLVSDQLVVRLRAINIIQAHLPPDCKWPRDLDNLSDKQPLAAWIKKYDDYYLKSDRTQMIRAQSAYFGFRWKAHMPLADFLEQLEKLQREYERHNNEELSMAFIWDQLETSYHG